jgi:hypothetical protein
VAKRYEDPIEVATEEAGSEPAPLAFRWRGRQYFVDERLSSWREAGEWWLASGAAREREYFRVLAHPAGSGATGDLDPDGFIVSCSSVYDIYRDRIKGEWRMARVWD